MAAIRFWRSECARASVVALTAAFSAIAGVALADNAKALSPDAAWYAAYERDARLIPLPDGRKLNLYCMGSGSPTVVLESGIGSGAFDWRAVQEAMAKQTRVCAYDHAGLGKSTAGPLPRDTKAEVADLEALLKAADLHGPYVLVGHSMGGYNVRLFASRHLNDVAGIVLVDPSVEDQLPLIEAAAPAIAANDKKSEGLARYCGVPDPAPDVVKNCSRPAPADFPPDLAAAWVAAHGPASMQTFGSEVLSFLTVDSAEVAAERRSFGAIPLVILTRGERSQGIPADQAEAEWKIWNGLHEGLTKLSSASVHRVIPGANHYIQIDKPEAVIEAVQSVVTTARQTANE